MVVAIQVKAILVNIFGGIVNCATIANGIIGACREIDPSLHTPGSQTIESKYILIQHVIKL